jgi:hypothetical protein
MAKAMTWADDIIGRPNPAGIAAEADREQIERLRPETRARKTQ